MFSVRRLAIVSLLPILTACQSYLSPPPQPPVAPLPAPAPVVVNEIPIHVTTQGNNTVQLPVGSEVVVVVYDAAIGTHVHAERVEFESEPGDGLPHTFAVPARKVQVLQQPMVGVAITAVDGKQIFVNQDLVSLNPANLRTGATVALEKLY